MTAKAKFTGELAAHLDLKATIRDCEAAGERRSDNPHKP